MIYLDNNSEISANSVEILLIFRHHIIALCEIGRFVDVTQYILCSEAPRPLHFVESNRLPFEQKKILRLQISRVSYM